MLQKKNKKKLQLSMYRWFIYDEKLKKKKANKIAITACKGLRTYLTRRALIESIGHVTRVKNRIRNQHESE